MNLSIQTGRHGGRGNRVVHGGPETGSLLTGKTASRLKSEAGRLAGGRASLQNHDFAREYQSVLGDYILQGGRIPSASVHGNEESLHAAYELGHRALTDGMGLLEISSLHEHALSRLMADDLRKHDHDDVMLLLKASNRFLAEVISPFELSRLGSKNASGALRRLYEVLEEEAKRVAHILHDESSQILAVIYLELAQLSRESSAPVAKRVTRVVEHLDQVREQLRGLSHELRPLILDQLGLLPALKFLSSGVSKRTGLKIEIKVASIGRLPQSIETVVYRTVQEALANVSRHASARRVEVSAWIHENVLYCVVSDDGVGFEIDEDGSVQQLSGLGLIGIRERVASLGGECRISSQPGEGTELQVAIPL